MKKENLFEKLGELKEKFKGFFQHRKKIKALENYSDVERFPHRNYLTLVKTCLNEGFLEEKESEFLDHILDKYQIRYLDWAHRTKWLKQQMQERKANQPKVAPLQTFFNFGEPPIKIPLEILTNKGTLKGKRL